ncbi:MAG: hypothetical protein LWX02_08040 [Deltaproteobacteria bacterium]|jgi:pentatricopeptide repeat protein|nr:hypothetical protein [Desulfobacterales bacterium]MDL1981405.1 hypothetical protein [Deltaproteobacteria bacterium]MDL1988085.1 hypothetical protein [Deltaproteobacteria bacterium]
MNNQTDFYTKTMANVYAKQGYFAKAVEIYRHLLKYDPESRELNDLLSEVEKKLNEKQKKDRESLEKLFRKWIYLQLSCNMLQKLKNKEL